MTIVDALKNVDLLDIRVTHYDKWLYCAIDKFIVCSRKRGQKHNRVIIITENEEEAVNALIKED